MLFITIKKLEVATNNHLFLKIKSKLIWDLYTSLLNFFYNFKIWNFIGKLELLKRITK